MNEPNGRPRWPDVIALMQRIESKVDTLDARLRRVEEHVAASRNASALARWGLPLLVAVGSSVIALLALVRTAG